MQSPREKVIKYMREHSEADLEELMINLKIPLRTLVNVVNELRKEGILSPPIGLAPTYKNRADEGSS